MPLPVNAELKVNHPYSAAHANSIFKHDFRSKAAAETYFNAFGANTIIWYGTEGVDYQFDAELGFRSLTNSGGARIKFSNMLDSLQTQYFLYNGFTFDFELLTSQWMSPEYTPALYSRPVTDLPGANAGALSGTSMLQFWYRNDTYANTAGLRCEDDVVNFRMFGNNKLKWSSCDPTSGDQIGSISRSLSLKSKGKFLTCRVTTQGTGGNMWVDQMPYLPLHGGNAPTGLGPRSTKATVTAQMLYTDVGGVMSMTIGTFNGASLACTRWIRNIRLFNCPTNNAVHPLLRYVGSFGDSYSATSFGPPVPSATVDNIGSVDYPGQYSSAVGDFFGDINPQLRYAQLLTQAGFQIGELFASGFGGRNFYDTLLAQGFLTQALRYKPSLMFTFGLHNDITPVALGTITLATLQNTLLTSYLKPMFDTGCKGWGFVIPAVSSGLAVYETTFDAVAGMLIGLPAVFNATYPQYAGRVKVRDIRTSMGKDWPNNINWHTAWTPSEVVHPSRYGEVLFAEACAQMTLEWLGQ